MDLEPLLRTALQDLLRELTDGPPGDTAYVVNLTDPGILGSLERLSAAEASARPGGRSSVASHVDHVRFGFEMMNRWNRGENPFADADFGASWRRQQVTDTEWRELRDALAREAHAWAGAFHQPRQWDPVWLGAAIGSVAHLAYHLGAIRQLIPQAAGPRE